MNALIMIWQNLWHHFWLKWKFKNNFTVELGVIGLLLLSPQCFAHPGHGLATFYSGFLHPISGLDHLLTALAVGLWTAQSDRKLFSFDITFGPLSFLFGICGGALAAQKEIVLPFCEQGILISCLFLGCCLALNFRSKLWLSMGLLFIFGTFHGNAHGRETIQETLNWAGWSAMAGFLSSTAILHGIGIFCTFMFQKNFKKEQAIFFLRWTGIGLLGSALLI